VPNCTPHDLLEASVGAARDNEHWSLATYEGSLGKKWVVEDLNDHSAIVRMINKFPSPFQDRESIIKYTWREMEPGTILYLTKSVEHEACPRSSRYVRMEVKFYASVTTAIPNTNSTRQQIMLMADPKGIIPAMVVNAVGKGAIEGVRNNM
jgi:hypothetical protein